MENIFTKETKYRLVSSILFLIFAFVCRTVFIGIGFLIAGVMGLLNCNSPNKKTVITAMVILMSLCFLQFIYNIVDSSIVLFDFKKLYDNYNYYYTTDLRLYEFFLVYDIVSGLIMLSAVCCFAIGNFINKNALVIVATILLGVVASWDMAYQWIVDSLVGYIATNWLVVLDSVYYNIISCVEYTLLVFAFILNAKTLTRNPKEIPQPMYNYNNYGY